MTSVFEIEKIITKQNNYTIRVNGYFLHSKYDPEKEAKQFIEKNYRPNHTTILFGYGMGYFANALISKKSVEEKLIIMEPLLDNDVYIEHSKDTIFIQEMSIEKMKTVLMNELNMYSNIHIICSPNYNNLFPNLYYDILSVIKERISVNKIAENTLRSYSQDWQENYIFNLSNTLNDKSLEDLFQKFSCPVVIASGGPSLTKQIEQLKKVKDRIILIAAGSTINTLLIHDISPDYIVSIDGGEANHLHFKHLKLKKPKLIYSMFSHYLIRDSFSNPAYYFLSSDAQDLQGHFEKVIGSTTPIISGGGSVANYALTIAKYISSGPITLIGQDLAYTDNKTHAEHNKNFYVIDEDYMKKRDIFLTKGYYEEKVLTDYAFYTMKENFESLIKSYLEDQPIYNSTEGGIYLEGFKQISFIDFCRKYATEINNRKIEFNVCNELLETSYEGLIVQMEKETMLYDKIKTILKESLNTLMKNKNSITFSHSVLKKIDKNDKKLEDLFKQVSMSIILAPITMDVLQRFSSKLNETDKEKFHRVFEQSKTLYVRLLEVTNISQQCTNKLIENLKKKSELSNNESLIKRNNRKL